MKKGTCWKLISRANDFLIDKWDFFKKRLKSNVRKGKESF